MVTYVLARSLSRWLAGDRVKVSYRVDNRSGADLDAWLLESCDCDAGDLAMLASLVVLCSLVPVSLY